MVFMASVDIRRHLTSLTQIARLKYPKTAFRQLMFVVHYGTIPTIVDVVTIADALYSAQRDDRFPKAIASDVTEESLESARIPGEAPVLVVYPSALEQGHIFQETISAGKIYTVPKLKPGAVRTRLARAGGQMLHGPLMVPVYDDIDEIIYRAKQKHVDASRKQAPKHPWDYLGEAFDEIAEEWPLST